jgi:hypothetical protein
MTQRRGMFEVQDLGRCSFKPVIGVPFEEDPGGLTRRLRDALKVNTPPDLEPAPGILVFKVVGGIAVPADKATRDLFIGITRLINRYLAMAGEQLSEASIKMLATVGVTQLPLRVPTDGKLSNTHLVGLHAVIVDFNQKLGTGPVPPTSVDELARDARRWTAMLNQVIADAASGQRTTLAAETAPSPAPKKKSGIKVAVGLSIAASAGLWLALR